ncbi:MAG: CYTH domain-containing protein [Chloroflexi bacterium]|nr:CYTH domain-containing protein [Chloroflexota bacterium]
MTEPTTRPATSLRPHLERELRFLPVERLPIEAVRCPTWHSYQTAPLPVERHLTTYYETPSLALARLGITFRQRVFLEPNAKDDRPIRAELTVKLPRNHVTGRLSARPEYTQPLSFGAPLTDHPLLDLVADYTPVAAIAPWFVARVTRVGRSLWQADAVLHLLWDRMTLPAAPNYVDTEIEAELVFGPVEALDDLALLLTAGYGLHYGDVGKRSRAGRHLAGLGMIDFPA